VELAMPAHPDQKVAAGHRKLAPLSQPPAPRYPADLACDVTTKAGTKVHLRPIRPDDAPRLIDFHQHLSPRSVYRRFFFVHPR